MEIHPSTRLQKLCCRACVTVKREGGESYGSDSASNRAVALQDPASRPGITTVLINKQFP
jgi:hypothetical protein